jgi:hypothetical protein
MESEEMQEQKQPQQQQQILRVAQDDKFNMYRG